MIILIALNGMSTHNHFCICLPFSVSENLYGLENSHFTMLGPLLLQGLFVLSTLSPLFTCISVILFQKIKVNTQNVGQSR